MYTLDNGQLCTVLLGCAQLGLLVGMLVTTMDARLDVYVSTDLKNLPQCNMWLTVTVLAQALSASLYLAIASGDREVLFVVGVCGAVSSVVGWCVLSTYNMDTSAHDYGVVFHIAGVGLYYLSMIVAGNDEGWKCHASAKTATMSVFLALYCTAGALMATYVTYNYEKDYAHAVMFEWTSFILVDLIYILFFATHHFKPPAPPVVTSTVLATEHKFNV